MPRYSRHIDMNRFFCFFSVLFLLLSCHHAMIDANQVEQIVFYPIPKGVEHSASLSCFRDVWRANGRDTAIVDRPFIKEFCHLLNNLQFDKAFEFYDYRCGVVLKMKSGAENSYCFGESWGILYNDCRTMEDYQPIFDFIDKNIYGTQSKEYWLSDYDREISEFIRKYQFQLDSLEAAQYVQ